MRPWLRDRYANIKPPPSTPIDWSHPLAQGLQLAFLFNEGGGIPREYVKNLQPSAAVGNVAWSTGKDGQAGNFSSAVAGYGNPSCLDGAGRITFVMSIRPTSWGTTQGIIQKRTGFSSQDAFSICTTLNVANDFSLAIGNASGTGLGANYYCDASTWSTTQYTHLVAVYDSSLGTGARIKIWKDRLPQTVTVGNEGNNALPATTSNIEIGRVNNSTLYYGGGINYIYVYRDIAFAQPQVDAIFTQPFSMFAQPKRALFVPAAASASTTFRRTLSGLGTRTRSRQLVA